MKRFIAFTLAFIMIIGTVASAAPGDIIHMGNKKVYKPNSPELTKDIIDGANIRQFYREIEPDADGNRRFVNLVEEEEEQIKYLQGIIKNPENNIKSSEDLAAYLANEENKTDMKNFFENKTIKISQVFDEDVLNDYFDDLKAPKLKVGDNYSNPVAGSTDGTSQIINLSLPKGASKWIYKVGEDDFVDLKFDTVVTGSEYSSGRNITVKPGQYLLLAAVDGGGKLKAYASIEILEAMIKTKVDESEDINVDFNKSTSYSGATRVTGELVSGTWKIGVPNSIPETIYKDTKFNNVKDYVADMELVLASDNELDKGLDGFEKKVVVYGEKDGLIDKYRIFTLTADNVSGLLVASPLDGENYSAPIPGKSAGTTQIVNLKLPEGDSASKWMYAIVEDPETKPYRDRIYSGSQPYEAGENIKIDQGKHLMILATDDNHKVRAYGIITIIPEMIKDPDAYLLKPTTHYGNIAKGKNPGETYIKVQSSPELNNLLTVTGDLEWKYLVSKDRIDVPEANSAIGELEDVASIDDGIVKVIDNVSHFDEEPFTRNLLLLATEGGFIKGYAIIPLNQNHVKFPEANKLTQINGVSGNYSLPEKGSLPGTTKIASLKNDDLSHREWYYKVVKDDKTIVEYKQLMGGPDGFNKYTEGNNIPAKADEYIVLVSVDARRKALAYKNIRLGNEVMADFAVELKPISNYEGPIPGSVVASTKFTKLHGSENKWFYKIGEGSFGKIEAGFDVSSDADYIEYKSIGGDIAGDFIAGNWLLLVRTDSSNKVTGYANILLTSNHIRGGELQQLKLGGLDPNFKVSPGSKPGATKFTDFNLSGIDGHPYNGWKWMYKLINEELKGGDLPYLNQRVDGRKIYIPGSDINVSEPYGWILLLATDSSEQTKAYAQFKITSDMVSEHAPEIMTVILKGTKVDSVKFDDLPVLTGENKYKYLISDTRPETPASGDNPPSGVVPYDNKDIQIHIGKHLNLYEVDPSGKVVKFSSFKVEEVAQPTVELKLVSPTNLVEGNIVNGGTRFTITLNDPDGVSMDASWADNITDKSVRDKVFNGFKAHSEANEWAKVIAAMVADGRGAISLDDKVLTILLPQTLYYDIKTDQVITLTLPHEAIKDGINPLPANGEITIKPTIGAKITGDVVNSIVRESDIIAGGKTIVIELADGIWANDVSGIVDGFTGGYNWGKIAGAIKANGSVRRTSGTIVTITLPPVPKNINFNTTPELVSLEIPQALILGATDNVVVSPNFTLYPNKIQVIGEIVEENSKVVLQAPDYKILDLDKDTWIIEMKAGTLKEKISDKDLDINGLPRGLTSNISQDKSGIDGKDRIMINLTGVASGTLADKTKVKVKIKGSAVNEPNAEDSEEIELELVQGISNLENLKNIKVDVLGKRFKYIDTDTVVEGNDIQYSFDSTNGINGEDWANASSSDINFKAGKVHVRDANNHRVNHLVTTLAHDKAPTGINPYDKPVDYDGVDKEVELSGFETDKSYDYSIDGGNEWNPLNTKDIPLEKITLKADYDLRVRYRATEDKLYSHPTAKLNGLYLGNITMNVADGKLEGTTTGMEYSLNGGESYVSASNTTTSVNFFEGAEVVVREKSKPRNQYSVGTKPVDVVEKPKIKDGSNDIVSFDISAATITDDHKRGLQYRIGNDPWKDLSNTVAENKDITFKQGKLEVRAKGSKKDLPSEAVELANILAPIQGPELKTDDFNKDISYLVDKVWTNIEDLVNPNLLEYKINDEGWKNASDWASDKLLDKVKNSNPRISVRTSATASELASLATVVNFTGNLTFENVRINVGEGKIDGTTTAMQYSTTSTDGLNGTWIDAKKDSTPVQFIKGTKVFIREKSKPFNFKDLLEDLNEPREIGIEVPITVIDDKFEDIKYSVLNGTMSNNTSRTLEYRLNENKWTTVDIPKNNEMIYGIAFTPGTLQFRAKGTATTLPSLVAWVNIKERASKPQLKYDDFNHTIEKIGENGDGRYEFSTDNGVTWIDGTKLVEFQGGSKVLVRLKATDNSLPSMEQEITFKKNLILYNVLLNAGKSQLENTNNLMEYSLNSTNGEDGEWFTCTSPTTALTGLKASTIVHVRELGKPRNKRKVTTEKFGKRTLSSSFVEDNLDFNILEKTISFIYSEPNDGHQEIVNNLQYRVGAGLWVNMDYVSLGEADKVLAYNVDFVQGNLEFRLKGDLDNLPSDSVLKDTIKAAAAKPNVSIGFKNTPDKYENVINGDITDLQYSFSENGPWFDIGSLDNGELVKDIYIRTKATTNTLPSSSIVLNFKPVLNLKVINYSDHVQPLELNGTTKDMEYMINGSNIWLDCTDGNTKLQSISSKPGNIVYLNDKDAVKKIEIRDKNQHGNTVTIHP